MSRWKGENQYFKMVRSSYEIIYLLIFTFNKYNALIPYTILDYRQSASKLIHMTLSK